MKLRSQLYRYARLIGDKNAATNGFKKAGLGGAIAGEAKRQMRKKIYSKSNSTITKVLRKTKLF